MKYVVSVAISDQIPHVKTTLARSGIIDVSCEHQTAKRAMDDFAAVMTAIADHPGSGPYWQVNPMQVLDAILSPPQENEQSNVKIEFEARDANGGPTFSLITVALKSEEGETANTTNSCMHAMACKMLDVLETMIHGGDLPTEEASIPEGETIH